MAEVERTHGAESIQVLSFPIDDESFAIDILRVHGVQRWERAAIVPNAPPCVVGVINVRGAVVPVVEVRALMGLGRGTYDKTSVVILVQVRCDDSSRIVGLLANAISDVCELAKDSLRPPPPEAIGDRETFIAALTYVGGRSLAFVDVDAMLRAVVSEPSNAA